MQRTLASLTYCLAVTGLLAQFSRAQESLFELQIAPLLKSHCAKCHGPAKTDAELNLSTPTGIVRGGESGSAIIAHDPTASLLWQRIDSNEMPPEHPLRGEQKELIKQWILAGAPGLPQATQLESWDEHWAFRPLVRPALPKSQSVEPIGNEIDLFLQAAREAAGIAANSQADMPTLVRRVSLDVTGLPPTLLELERFSGPRAHESYAQMVDYYLASPQYGVRWGKVWLDAAGYADSNGYFSADSDRPLAYRYRDYVVRSLNADRPFDRFVKEQIAGDELAAFQPGQAVSEEIVELLEATHFLRNGQDGSGESDGNPDEVRADRYYALESAMQNSASALLGLTIQCAKCHDHKFEPISQLDYYRWQAILYPTFHIEKWVKPNDRFVYAPLPGEHEQWETEQRSLESRVTTLKHEFGVWLSEHRPQGDILFEDHFDAPSLMAGWSATAPGDDTPGGLVPVKIDSNLPPAAQALEGRLQIIEGNTQGDSWISTTSQFDWTPNEVGEAIQVTFDLCDDKLAPEGTPAFRIGYLLALHDFNDNSPIASGNLLIDGNPMGSSLITCDYPGPDSHGIGSLGSTGYLPGHNYGIRITNIGDGKFRLEQLVDQIPEEPTVELPESDLPDGGFGFEYCCSRSFLVDNVVIERLAKRDSSERYVDDLRNWQNELRQAIAELKMLSEARPGKIAWAGDMSSELPQVHLLVRGNYTTPGQCVEPDALSILEESDNTFESRLLPLQPGLLGWRLAWASWLTTPGSRAAGLLARVQVNRLWQQHFGTGIAASVENLGVSGLAPSHPELLEWLACHFVERGWSLKSVHRLILNSAAYRQASNSTTAALSVDPRNRLYGRYPIRRLDAEAIRDSMLAVSGELDLRLGGPYTRTSRLASGEVIAPETDPNALRRSLYLSHKRTQVLSFLAVFDSPSIVFNSIRRNSSTMPLQSLTMLNSEFALKRSAAAAQRLEIEVHEGRRLTLAYRCFYAREPTAGEAAAAAHFLDTQASAYPQDGSARTRAWQDLCQALFASNEFLYYP